MNEIGLEVASLGNEKTILANQVSSLTLPIAVHQKHTLTALDRCLLEMTQKLLYELASASNENLIPTMKANR